MVFSSSTKAPPQIKRISLVSTCIPPQTNRLCWMKLPGAEEVHVLWATWTLSTHVHIVIHHNVTNPIITKTLDTWCVIEGSDYQTKLTGSRWQTPCKSLCCRCYHFIYATTWKDMFQKGKALHTWIWSPRGCLRAPFSGTFTTWTQKFALCHLLHLTETLLLVLGGELYGEPVAFESCGWQHISGGNLLDKLWASLQNLITAIYKW